MSTVLMNAIPAEFAWSSFDGPPVVFRFFFVVIFGIVVVRILTSIFKGVGDWSGNLSEPMLSEEATVVAKRSEVAGRQNSTGTTYFVTFETNGSQRNELKVSGRQFGLLAEGDRGTLVRQGTRFERFDRQLASEPPMEAEPPSRKILACDYCGAAIPSGQTKCASCGWAWKPKPAESNPVG